MSSAGETSTKTTYRAGYSGANGSDACCCSCRETPGMATSWIQDK
jgi:hypothetical protein